MSRGSYTNFCSFAGTSGAQPLFFIEYTFRHLVQRTFSIVFFDDIAFMLSVTAFRLFRTPQTRVIKVKPVPFLFQSAHVDAECSKVG